MSETKFVYRCLDNPAHSFWGSNKMDGITCPVCRFQVIATGHYEPKYYQLPYYCDLKKQCTDSKREVDIKQY
ncbi:hypothetical protein [Lysinibacillus sp. NPDC086135]|uniref:hypothetical protein n=1 Tax=Lysinibacillus sp. NPDC086135 TaxID=3364130 RepID=UPI003813ACE7